MRKMILHTILMLGIAVPAVQATIITLDPATGPVEAPPGGTTGWGFTFESPDPTKWVSVIGSVLLFESNPILGYYTDLIGAQGGPVAGFLPPGSPAWVQTFDENAGTGIGYYTIDPLAIPGAQNSGTLRILYELYTDNPATCGGCFDSEGSADAEFLVQVQSPATSAVPEPESAALVLAGAAAVAVGRLKRR